MEIEEATTAGLGGWSREFLQRGVQELERVVKYYLFTVRDLVILRYVLTDDFYLAVRSIAELVDDQVRVVSTEVVK